MKTTGGMIHIKSHHTPADAFNFFLNNSVIQYFSSGSYGIIFKAILYPHILDSPYESFNPHSGYTDLRVIIFKIVFLSDAERSPSYEFDMDDYKFELFSVTSDSFKKETNIQVDIHEKSYDYGEPICPSVIFSTIIGEDGVLQFDQSLLFNLTKSGGAGLTIETVSIVHQIDAFVRGREILQMGIIVMEFAENYSMLYDILNSRLLNDGIKQHCINMTLYLLIELYKLGYIHGDHHSENILINIDYQGYFGRDISGRPLIIDFGRTQLLTEVFSHAKLLELKGLYNRGLYTELLIQLNRYDLTKQNNKKKYGYASGVYDAIDKIDQRGFPENTNEEIHRMLTLHKETTKLLEKQGDIISEQREKATPEEVKKLERIPIYPLDNSDPNPRRVRTYRNKLGGSIKKSRRKNKKKRKGKTHINRKRTIKNKE